MLSTQIYGSSPGARNFSTRRPRAADVSRRVIEARMSTVALSIVPPEHLLVKRHRLAHIHRRNLQVAQTRPRQHLDPAPNLRHFRPPFLRTHVSRMPREKPVMSLEIFRSILPFAILGLVQLLHDLRARRLRPAKMPIDVLHERRQALRSVAYLRWTAPSRSRFENHDPR